MLERGLEELDLDLTERALRWWDGGKKTGVTEI